MTDESQHTQVARIIGSRDRVSVIVALPSWALVRDLHNAEPPYWLEAGRLSSYRDAAATLRRICA